MTGQRSHSRLVGELGLESAPLSSPRNMADTFRIGEQMVKGGDKRSPQAGLP